MRIFLLFLGLVILAVGGWFIFSNAQQPIREPTIPSQNKQATTSPTAADYSASFAIFTNGTFRIFTASMYHNLSPDVFIESSNPNIVHVKKAGITWDDFFKTLPFKLTEECLTTGTGQTFCTNSNQTLKFYINGELDSNVLDRIINAGDQLLVSYGSENEAQIQKQLERIPTLN